MAVDFGRKQLRAIWTAAGRTRGGVRIRRTLVEDVPPEIDAQDTTALGAWAGERLKAAGMPRGKAVVLLGREHVVIKRFSLPTIESAELPDMVRLSISRDLPFDLDSAAIDFLPLQTSGTSTMVLAVATSQAVIDRVKAIAHAAGLTVGRVALRTLGAAALVDASHDASWALSLLEHNSPTNPPCNLIIDVRNDNIELAVTCRSVVEFSRAAEVPEPQDKLAIAEAVVTETRRTWMSFQTSHANHAAPIASMAAASAPTTEHSQGGRNSSQQPVLREAVLLGERRVCEYVAKPVEQLLGVPTRVLDAHPLIDLSGHDVDQHWPLAGALLEEAQQREVIDLAHPRRAPDLNARARQRRLIAAGVALVACLGAWTLARQQLNSLTTKADELVRAQREQLPVIARYWRDRHKLDHLKQWEASKIDWLQHASYLTSIAPPPDRLVLDTWTGTLDFKGVKYDKSTGKWSVDSRVTISLDGEAKDRDTADDFRAALVQSSIYETATPGADARTGRRMPFAFTYTLRTRNGAPLPNAAPDSQVVKANGGKP